jgi:flavin reductase (DIM6/NTAB) family NADH-FMN oxidoreductase RutF
MRVLEPIDLTTTSAHAAFARIPSCVTVVTTMDGSPRGMTISSLSTLSLSPPQLLIACTKESGTFASIRRTGQFAVNLLSDAQADLSTRFAAPYDAAKFEAVQWTLMHGLPILRDAAAAYGCSMLQTIATGDHCLLIARVDWYLPGPGEPLLRYRHTYRQVADLPPTPEGDFPQHG